MAEKRRPQGNDRTEIYNCEKNKVQRKLDTEREKLRQLEIKECTFTPAIIKIDWKDIASVKSKSKLESKQSENSNKKEHSHTDNESSH